jgi:hypothetical protein
MNATKTSPFSKLWLALSQPCGNLDQDYVLRNVTISSIYDATNSDCKYENADTTHYHTLFTPTTFMDQEYSVYT